MCHTSLNTACIMVGFGKKKKRFLSIKFLNSEPSGCNKWRSCWSSEPSASHFSSSSRLDTVSATLHPHPWLSSLQLAPRAEMSVNLLPVAWVNPWARLSSPSLCQITPSRVTHVRLRESIGWGNALPRVFIARTCQGFIIDRVISDILYRQIPSM